MGKFESGDNGLEQVATSYPQQALLGRFTQTPGILLNVRELAALVHLPDPSTVAESVETARFSAPAPKIATQDNLAPFGRNATVVEKPWSVFQKSSLPGMLPS